MDGPDSHGAPQATQQPPWWRRTRDEQAYLHASRRLETPMLVLAAVFTVALVVGEVADLSRTARALVGTVNIVVWAAFAAEYLLLLRLSPNRGRFVRTHLLDLLIIVVPFLRPLRILRLARVVAVAARVWKQVFAAMRHRGLGGVIAIVLTLIVIAGVVAYVLEPDSFHSVGDAIWWVLVTATTVGYGDLVPVGAGARVVAIVVMVIGIGLVGVITANIVEFLMDQPDDGAAISCPTCAASVERLARIEARLEELTVGLGPQVGAEPDSRP